MTNDQMIPGRFAKLLRSKQVKAQYDHVVEFIASGKGVVMFCNYAAALQFDKKNVSMLCCKAEPIQ